MGGRCAHLRHYITAAHQDPALAARGLPTLSTNFVQIQRMGNALINEVIIGTGDKDKFSMSEPKNDSQFASYVLDPLLARAINASYGGGVQIPTPPRTDLYPLVQYQAPICPGCSAAQAGPVADLLRRAIKASHNGAFRKRLGFIAGDSAGYPNGRRVSDDVTDISIRAAVGLLKGAPYNGFPNNRLGDGVNMNDKAYQATFPYVGFAQSGRDSRHVDPGCAAPTSGFPAAYCP